jgi:hypothetical protein
MGNNCCTFIDYIDEYEEYTYRPKPIYYKKNTNVKLKTIYEDDETENISIENCIIELDNNTTPIEKKNELDLNETYNITDKPESYDIISLSNDTIIYTSDNSTEIV